MNIQTQLEIKDFKALLAFNQRHLRLATEKRDSWVFVVLGLVLGAVLALGPAGLFPFHLPSAAIAFLIAFLVVFVTFYRLVRRHQERLLPNPNSCRLGSHLYKITDEGFFDCSPNMDVVVRWPAVLSLQETARYFFVMIDRASGYILPKRSFSSDTEMERFRRTVLTHLVN